MGSAMYEFVHDRRSGCTCVVVGVMLILLVPPTEARGYVVNPPSRAYLCYVHKNESCGAARDDPVMESTRHFPRFGPHDGHLVGGKRMPELDREGVRWPLTTISTTEVVEFVWHLQVSHPTLRWFYYITQLTWNGTLPLTRNDFMVEPFCVADEEGRVPPPVVVHRCKLPPTHEGYHVVLAIWEIADSIAGHYQAIDMWLSNK